MEVNLFDYNNLSGNDQFFIWNKDDIIKYNITNHNINSPNLYVDEHIFEIKTSKSNYGLLLEPRCIKPRLYQVIEEHLSILNSFKKIITHDDRLLKLSNKFYNLPFTGGCFILERDRGIHHKSKILSTVVSQKKDSEGHRLRHRIAKAYAKYIDVFGPEYINLYTYPKCDNTNICNYYDYVTGNLSRAYKDYMFSIVIENQKQDIFFTEKILNCFATGTVPIYWGARNIGQTFNTNGIIQISDIEELDTIIPKLSKEYYTTFLTAIEDNFARQFNFLSYDKHIRMSLYD